MGDPLLGDRVQTKIELTSSYRSTRNWVMLLSWVGIFWASSSLNITKISIPSINEIFIADGAIPFVILIMLIFAVILMHNEYAMMPIGIRRNSSAIFDFRLFLFLSKLAIASLAVSVEVRSIKQIVIFLSSFIPIAIIIGILGLIFGFLIVAVGSRFRKTPSGFASWVITMFGLGSVVAKIMMITSIVGVALGLTYSDLIRGYFGIYPTAFGTWTAAIVAITLITQQHFEGIYSNTLFGFEIYNPRTNTKKYYDENGRVFQIIENYKQKMSNKQVLRSRRIWK